jgi:DNA-binding IclR family transcriptional regulator
MRQKILSRPKKKFTPLTITDTDQLRERLNDVMRDGYAVTLGENHPEMGGIAAPIRNHSDIVVTSCGVAIPAFRMDAELIERCTKLVLKTATAISTDLGHMRQNVHPPRINKLRLSEFKHTRR